MQNALACPLSADKFLVFKFRGVKLFFALNFNFFHYWQSPFKHWLSE